MTAQESSNQPKNKSVPIFEILPFGGIDEYTKTCIIQTVKPVEWLGSARKDLQSFPSTVRAEIGYQLYCVQNGLDPSDWKCNYSGHLPFAPGRRCCGAQILTYSTYAPVFRSSRLVLSQN